MAPEPLELALPETLDGAGAIALLASRLKVEPGRARSQDRVLMDTFDGRLRAAGLVAERTAGRSGPAQLRLLEPGAPPRSAPVGAHAHLTVADLPPGAVRDRLAPVLGVRALVPLARVRSRVHALAILNDDAKTVVRLEVELAQALVRGREPAPLTPRLRAAPVLGYDGAFRRAQDTLTGKLGLAATGTTLFDEAVAAVGGRPEGMSSKVGLKLAPGLRADAAAGAVLGRLADIAEANVAGTLEDLDSEYLHDLRVAVRRARSVLRELEGVHPPQDWSHLREELRWVQAMTGPARDLDVQLLEWEELTRALPPKRVADLRPLHELLGARRRKALKDLRKGLQSPRFAEAMKAWRTLAALRPAPAGEESRPRATMAIDALASDRIRRVYRRMVKEGEAIGDDTPPEALHDLRKRGKELRYLLELFGGLYPPDVVKPMVAALKGLQDVLGRFQDRAVQAEMLRGIGPELAAQRGGPDALMALGLAVEALLADQQKARDAFAKRFAAFASPEQRELVRTTFPKP